MLRLVVNAYWMGWNIVLALVPVALSVVLFVPGPKRAFRSAMWWIGVAAFVAFLPNAPYVITDLVHLPRSTGATSSELVELALLCEFVALILVGFGAYVLSLRNLMGFLARQGWTRARTSALELVLHGLCAVGVYLGRVGRFNSWDLMSRPAIVADQLRRGLDRQSVLVGMATLFVVLVLGTAVTNAVIDDAAARHRIRRA